MAFLTTTPSAITLFLISPPMILAAGPSYWGGWIGQSLFRSSNRGSSPRRSRCASKYARQGAHIAPVPLFFIRLGPGNRVFCKIIRENLLCLQHPGYDVGSEIVLFALLRFHQGIKERASGKDIVAHGRIHPCRIIGYGNGILRAFPETRLCVSPCP